MYDYNSSPDPEIYSNNLSKSLLKTDFEKIKTICDEIISVKQRGGGVFTAGNGGSAASASHMINDLMKGCRVGNIEGFRAQCLNDANAVVTCLANDFSYEDVYSIILRTNAHHGDLLIVFSGSGNSENIIRACETARNMGMKIIGMGGRDGGKMKNLCDICMLAPTYNMEQIEDLHMIYIHACVSRIRTILINTWDIEVINYPTNIEPKFALFDFDGTVSLLREGWQPIMYNFFCEEILKCPKAPSEDDAMKLVIDFVDKLTGKQTIFQCKRLCEEIAKYRGSPNDPMSYKAKYLSRLMNSIKERYKALENSEDATKYLVPGTMDVLVALNKIGIKCYLASGTDEVDVIREAKLLGIDGYFEGIRGATDKNSTVCSKEQVIKQLISDNNLKGNGLVAFGDGYVEIELTKNTGGYAVAVATNEKDKDSSIDKWKRNRLVEAGADCVIPDFSNSKRLIAFILGGNCAF